MTRLPRAPPGLQRFAGARRGAEFSQRPPARHASARDGLARAKQNLPARDRIPEMLSRSGLPVRWKLFARLRGTGTVRFDPEDETALRDMARAAGLRGLIIVVPV